jgi:alpha-ketoglutarate-dependent taurine dioxygenase
MTLMLPEIVQRPHADLPAFLAAPDVDLDKLLYASGALLFRGFDVTDADRFARAVGAVSAAMLAYTYRSTPRSEEASRVYTSTEYPPEEEIPMHNENSYTGSWPLKLWFCCPRPAAAGGATPLADSRRVLDRLDPDLVARFTERRVRYVRNYRAGMDLPWAEVFQTDDREEVQRFCVAHGIEYAWRGDELHTAQTCDAVATHPVTGEAVWFNQAHLFHPSALGADQHEALLALFGPEGLPRTATFGDGSPIPAADLDAVRAAYRAEMVDVDWQRGDVLLIDNMLTAHGRRAYTPPRKVLVAMTDPMSVPTAGGVLR